MMDKAIRDFPRQFEYKPKIENKKRLKPARKFVLSGMGGSHLAAGLVNRYFEKPMLIYIHRGYGLPSLDDKELKESLFIASSYSGNTEEVIDGLKKAFQKKLNIIVIATGGKLIRFAKANNLPYIQMPNTGIQPRSALGFSTMALLKAVGKNSAMNELSLLAKKLKSGPVEKRGKKLAKELKNHIPLIYTSDENRSLAYNWKIKFNETGKIPAFFNVFPELNHNEMTGFDYVPKSKKLSAPFHCLMLLDKQDHPRVSRRMQITAKQYIKRGIKVSQIKIDSKNKWLPMFSNLMLADWTAYYTSQMYGAESEQVPMVEDFKKMMK